MNLPSFLQHKNLSEAEKLVLIESLGTMLRSGIPILEALESIAEDASNSSSRKLIASVASDVASGKTLSDAFSKYPATFERVFIAIVRSGETAGNLDKVLIDSARNLKQNIQTSSNIKSALFYPAIIVLVLLVVAFYSFSFALPKVAEIFFQMKIKLPAYSEFILRTSLFFSKYRYLVSALFLLSAAFGYKIMTTRRARQLLVGFLLFIPTFSQIVKLLDLARFTNTVATLLKAGVPIIQTLEIAKEVVIEKKLRSAIEAVQEDITKGATIEEGMKKHSKLFPALLRRVVRVGEEAGTLDQSLEDISSHYDGKFTEIVKNITVIIEPILIIFIAVVVAILMLSIITPLYQGIGALNQS